jgi:uncharacterized membrane protein YphA (DoxX/SURF4 family)
LDLFTSPAFVWTSALLLAGIFLPSAWSKLRAMDELEGIVADYRLLPEPFVRPVTRTLPILEIGAGLLLLVPATRASGALLAMALLSVFALAMAINLARGRREIDCGCFLGRQKERIGWPLVARNLVLVALAAPLAAVEPASSPGLLDGFTVVLAAGSLLALYAAFSRLAGLAPLRRLRRA